jgi:hypothetical protein
MSFRIISTLLRCCRVRSSVLALAIKWDLFVLTAFAMSRFLFARVHSVAFISSVVFATVTM